MGGSGKIREIRRLRKLALQEKRKWVIEDLLRTGSNRPALLCGFSHAGKSTIVRQAVVSLVTGDNFLGKRVQRSRVLYWCMEETRDEVEESLTRLGLPEECIDDIYIEGGKTFTYEAHLDEIALRLNDSENTIGKIPYGVVIIDNLRDFAVLKNENDNSEVGSAMLELQKRLTSKHQDVAFIVLHHLNKKAARDADALNRIAGGGAISGKTDIKWFMEVESGSKRRYFHTCVRGDAREMPETYLAFDATTTRSSLGNVVNEEHLAGRAQKKAEHAFNLETEFKEHVRKYPGVPKSRLIDSISGNKSMKTETVRRMIESGELRVREVKEGRAKYECIFLSGQTQSDDICKAQVEGIYTVEGQ